MICDHPHRTHVATMPVTWHEGDGTAQTLVTGVVRVWRCLTCGHDQHRRDIR